MGDIQITTYGEPRWGSKAAGTAMIRKDSQAHYFVDEVGVVDMRVVNLFTVLNCADGQTYYVLTAFFRQVDRQASAE
ncbi:MAG TPA: hypothetical protein VF897_15695 [Roseiflexaceae bacterium]